MLCVPAVAPGAGIGAEVDALVGRWSAIERQRSELDADWRERRVAGERQQALLEREKADLERLIEQRAAVEDDVSARRGELLAEQESLEADAAVLTAALPPVVKRLEALLPRLPPPLRALCQAELDNAAAAADTSGELRSVLALLDALAEFDQRIALHETQMPIGVATVEVQQVFIGLSHGYYVSRGDTLAGVGHSTPEGWRWGDPAGASPAAVRRLVDAQRSRGRLELLALPVSTEIVAP